MELINITIKIDLKRVAVWNCGIWGKYKRILAVKYPLQGIYWSLACVFTFGVFLFAFLVAFTWYAVHIFIAHVILSACNTRSAPLAWPQINRTHCTGDRPHSLHSPSHSHTALTLGTHMALAALQWTQLNGQQIWFICCFFLQFPKSMLPTPTEHPPQGSDVSGAEAYAFDDFNNLMKVMSDWPTFPLDYPPPLPPPLAPLTHDFPCKSLDDIRFRIHIHIH